MDVNIDNLEKWMATEMERLSLKDRNAIYEEIHGVSTMAIEETPQLLEESLRCFQAELDKIDGDVKCTYDFITRQEDDLPSKRLAFDRSFRLRFLRCVFFNPSKAATRMVRFFGVLNAMYGREALTKFDGTMDFFVGDKDIQVALRDGYLQLLPFRDRSGRKILVFVLDALEIEDQARIKIFMYMVFVAGEDEETQRNGIVILFWPGSKELRLPASRHRGLVSKVISAMPTRFASFHFCFPSTPFFQMARMMITVALKGGNDITRVKVHTGERMELQYRLMGYGIPVNLIPTTGTGTLKTKVFAQWAKARMIMDSYRKKGELEMHSSSSPTTLKMECPGVRDVIFRSAGKSCMLNPGNVAFRGIFEQYHSEHVQAGQTEKKNLVWKIVGEIESRGGLFLVWDKRGWWVPLEDRTEIRNKVAISLRGYNKQRKADENRQSLVSSTHVFEGHDGRKRIKRVFRSGEDSDDSLLSCQSC